jgi:chorismate mutase
MQRLNAAGIRRLATIHRGFSSFEKTIYRNLPMWHVPIELRRRIPDLPILCDPSHIGGRRELIASLAQQAMDLGFDGLIIESHTHPDEAWSDAAQQITPEVLSIILDNLVIRSTADTTESLKTLRRQIDEMDNDLIQLLSKRMRVCREIANFKKEHSIAVVQPSRYSEILDKRGAQGVLCGIGSDCIKTVFEAIHTESVRQQIEIINN